MRCRYCQSGQVDAAASGKAVEANVPICRDAQHLQVTGQYCLGAGLGQHQQKIVLVRNLGEVDVGEDAAAFLMTRIFDALPCLPTRHRSRHWAPADQACDD